MRFDASRSESTRRSGSMSALSRPIMGSGRWLRRQLRRERRRLRYALLCSLLVHGLLLSFAFDDRGLGLPGFGAPWRDRRIEMPDLRIVLVPALVMRNASDIAGVAEPSRQELIVPPYAAVPAATTSVAPSPTRQVQPAAQVDMGQPAAKAEAGNQGAAGSKATTRPERETPAASKGDTDVATPRGTLPTPASLGLQTGGTGNAAPAPAPLPEQSVIAVQRPFDEAFVAVPPQRVPKPLSAAAPSASGAAAVAPAPQGTGAAALPASSPASERIDQEALERRVEQTRLERTQQAAQQHAEQLAQAVDAAARLRAVEDSARQETQRQEADRQRLAQQELARHDAAQLEAARIEALQVEAARVEEVRLDAARQAAARVVATQAESARLEALRQEASRATAAQQEMVRVEALRLEAARVEAARQESVRQEAARQEAARASAAQQEQARVEAARLEATRQEAARVEALRLEAVRVESARQEAARQEAARAAAAQQEQARVEAARLEATRQESARQEAARQEAGRQEAARRQVEVAGPRQLASPVTDTASGDQAGRAMPQDRVADGSRAATAGRESSGGSVSEKPAPAAAGQGPPPRLPDAGTHSAKQMEPRLPVMQESASTGVRRRLLIGRTDPNAELILYAETWRRKVELNTTIDLVREALKRPHSDPQVTVAVRSNGTVESVTFNRSSGVREIDEAIRRIVHSLSPYQAFAEDLAREYDVIEIRRVWTFDSAIRLY